MAVVVVVIVPAAAIDGAPDSERAMQMHRIQGSGGAS